jgi:hypothetical protein
MFSRIDYHGWKSVRLATPALELIAPLDVGPRIVSLRRADGGRNVMAELPDQRGGRGEPDLRLRGGHRLWHAPEDVKRTYQPDNSAVELRELPGGRGFELAQPVETATGMEKMLRVELLGPRTLRLTHTLTNRNLWPIETAAWALTMLRAGGLSIVPLPPKGAHAENLLPRYSFVQWAYTDFSQPAWRFFPSFVSVDTRRVAGPQKLGLTHYPGWSAYWIAGDLFVKAAAVVAGARYPDGGCPFETFANPALTELETLSPLQVLAPGERIVHVETWGLLAGVPRPSSEAVYAADILPAVQRWLHGAGSNGHDASDRNGNGRVKRPRRIKRRLVLQ